MTLNNIGLAFSGGGFRAAVYHMGVLARLAEDALLENVTAISTVSGGSLGTGLIFTLNGCRWPTSAEYRDRILPKARDLLVTQDLQSAVIWRFLYAVVTLQWGAMLTRAVALSDMLQKRWGVQARLGDLPDRPHWTINATCYESGKDWRFEKRSAGDYVLGHTAETQKIMLSDALAASAGFPGLVGALAFDRTRYGAWHLPPRDDAEPAAESGPGCPDILRAGDFSTVHLWDGGVYDNSGLGVFHDFDRPHWKQDVNFLVVSDASGPPPAEHYSIGPRALIHIISGVMMPQIRGLQSRAVVALMRQEHTQAPGVYLLIGNTCEKVLTEAGVSPDVVAQIKADCLSPEQAAQAKCVPTDISRLTPDTFKNLFRHGFEVADNTLFAYHRDQFNHIPYGQSGWPSIVT